jgi:hypothetical protein
MLMESFVSRKLRAPRRAAYGTQHGRQDVVPLWSFGFFGPCPYRIRFNFIACTTCWAIWAKEKAEQS